MADVVAHAQCRELERAVVVHDNESSIAGTVDRIQRAWNSIGDTELDEVFRAGDCSDEQRNAAKDLIRCCLHGDPAQRPKVSDMADPSVLGSDQKMTSSVDCREKKSLQSAIASCQHPSK